MDASVIIRFSNKSQQRLRNLGILINHIRRRKNIEIIVSAMESNFPNIKGITKNYTAATFESSRANNIGASLASTNILIFQDADIIFHLTNYDRIIHKILKEKYQTVRVGEKCVNLNAQSAAHMVGNLPKVDQVLRKDINDSLRDAPGACVAIGKKAFIRIGGYCELFKVYGWEDCYFRYKAKKLTRSIGLNSQMVHLPHEINFQMKHQAKNAKLYHDLLYTDKGNCGRLAKRDRIDLLKKYPRLAR